MKTVRKTGSFGIKEQRLKFKRLKRSLPPALANVAKNQFLEGFRKGGGQSVKSLSGWRQRKRAAPGRAILVESGALRADIRVRKTSFNESIVGTQNIPYAARHNEGLAGMPQREFIGESSTLDAKLGRMINKAILQ